MSLLQNTGLLQGLSLNHGDSSKLSDNGGRQQASLRSKSSIANLIQFVRHPVENAGEAYEYWRDGCTTEERVEKQKRDDRSQILYLKLGNVRCNLGKCGFSELTACAKATKYEDWQAAAAEIDDIEGNNGWKFVFDSLDYDAALVESRLKQLDEARISCDVERMLFLIRTSLTRNLGDMGNIKLYKHAHIGTKDLIERYIASATETLEALLDVSAKCKCDGLESKYILEQVLSTRQAFGRSALLLSGGATFGMNHIGVLKVLWEVRLLPRIISGASAGSIVSAVLCSRTDEEIPSVLASFCTGDLAVFEEEGNEDGLLRKVARFLKHGSLFDISHLTRVMRDLLGDMTFQEAYNRTRKILNICVSSASLYELPRLLNYITAPNVLIWSAVAASCSVPLIFSAASILAKDPKTGEAAPWNPSPQRWIDGSVDNDLPMTRLAELFNVNHFIVSQVNPHVIPFLVKEEDSITEEAQQSASGPTWLQSFTQLAKGEALHRIHTMAELGIFPNTLTKAVSILNQKYSGDITILPDISYADFPRMLSNPTPEFMFQAMLCGERATWPKLSRIKNHCAIELALDDAVQKLRARVVFSPSQIDLRMGAHSRSNSDVRRGSRSKNRATKRALSQVRDPEPSSRANLHESKSGRSRSERHKRKLSINTLLDQRSVFPGSFPPLELPNLNRTYSLGTHKTYHHDLTSSSAETNRTASSSPSVVSLTSPMESPSSPSPLFPSTSQPTTPFHYPSPHTPPIKSSAISLSMTPKTSVSGPGSAESRYKRLFHSKSPREANVAVSKPKNEREKSEAGSKKGWTLDLNTSDARGIMKRRPKSGSGSEATK